MPRRPRLQYHERNPARPLDLQQRRQPALDPALSARRPGPPAGLDPREDPVVLASSRTGQKLSRPADRLAGSAIQPTARSATAPPPWARRSTVACSPRKPPSASRPAVADL